MTSQTKKQTKIPQSIVGELAGPFGNQPVDPKRLNHGDTSPCANDMNRAGLGPRGVLAAPDPDTNDAAAGEEKPKDGSIAEHTK